MIFKKHDILWISSPYTRGMPMSKTKLHKWECSRMVGQNYMMRSIEASHLIPDSWRNSTILYKKL